MKSWFDMLSKAGEARTTIIKPADKPEPKSTEARKPRAKRYGNGKAPEVTDRPVCCEKPMAIGTVRDYGERIHIIMRCRRCDGRMSVYVRSDAPWLPRNKPKDYNLVQERPTCCGKPMQKRDYYPTTDSTLIGVRVFCGTCAKSKHVKTPKRAEWVRNDNRRKPE